MSQSSSSPQPEQQPPAQPAGYQPARYPPPDDHEILALLNAKRLMLALAYEQVNKQAVDVLSAEVSMLAWVLGIPNIVICTTLEAELAAQADERDNT